MKDEEIQVVSDRQTTRMGLHIAQAISLQVRKIAIERALKVTGGRSPALVLPWHLQPSRPLPRSVSGKQMWKRRGKMSRKEYRRTTRFGGLRGLR
jgi:hypothetical protein